MINRQNIFWDSLSPLGGLTAMGILIMASARLSWAIIVSGCLLFVYGITVFSFVFLINNTGKKIFPQNGRKTLFICFASFWGCIYVFLIWLFSPFAALETFLVMMLVPLYCASSGIAEKICFPQEKSSLDIFEFVSESVTDAAVISVILIAFSIIREPLAYCSLSLPGTFRGMIMIFKFNENSFLPIRLFVSSAGALILMGYILFIFQLSKSIMFPGNRR